MKLIILLIVALAGFWAVRRIIWPLISVHRNVQKIERVLETLPPPPPPPVITPPREPDPANLAALPAALAALALPTLVLSPDPNAPVTPGCTRIGGQVWLPDGAAWPTGPDGAPLEFIAQLNFADLPPLADYPTAGLVQLFIGRDDLFGVNFDELDAGNMVLIWHPDGAIGGQMVPSVPLADRDMMPSGAIISDISPFSDAAVRANGMALCGALSSSIASPYDWPTERVVRALDLDFRHDAVSEAINIECSVQQQAHRIGGHPLFVQGDVRIGDRFVDYDRVLFQLTSDTGLMWGDVGEAIVMMRRADLLACDFTRPLWTWDCC